MQFRSRAIVVFVLVVPAAVVVTVAGAWAHDHRVPRAKLHVNEQVDRLHPWAFDWLSGSGQGCVSQSADGIPAFRPIAEVHRHSTPRIVFRKDQKPKRFQPLASTHVEDGYLGYPIRRLPVKLRAAHRGDRRVWVARLRATVRHRLFVDVWATWRDEEGCGGPQDANWAFRLKRG